MDDENFLDKLKKGSRSMVDKFILESFDLVKACEDGEIQIVERALRTGMKPDSPDGLGRIPMSMAVDVNQIEIISMLLKFGADPNLIDHEGNTPLIKAVEWAHHDMMALMMKHGGDFNKANKSGTTALDVAKGSNDESLVDRLTRHEEIADIKSKTKDLVIHEEQKKKAEAARKAREESEAKKQAELDAVRKAAVEKEKKAKAIIEEKAAAQKVIDLATKYKVKELGAAGALIAAIKAKDNVAIKTFIEEDKVDLNQVNKEGESPLSQAIHHAKLFDALCDAGADPFLSLGNQEAPIVNAIKDGTIGILPVLKSNGEDLTKLASGRSLIEWAVRFNRADWVNGLIAEGVDTLIVNRDGKTLLELAKEHEADEAIVQLFEGE